MKCFGSKTRSYHSKVVLLDEQELIEEILDTSTGQDLLATVFTHLNLVETAYFGLRYLDANNQTHWLDPNKRVWKQLKGTSPFTLYFSVKFYAADPCRLVEEITRYQFFLQVKQDILQGRLPVSQDLAAELGAYAVQSELGDYDPRRHSPGYVSEFRFVTTQTVALENRIADLHKKLIGQVPSKAELCYLEKVKWLDMYGVDLHPVLGEDNIEYFLGLTPSGVIVLRNKAKVGNYFWPRISKVYFRGRFFMLRVRDKNNSENTYGFETPSKAACKHLWQCCVEHHAFFRLTQASGNSPAAIFSLGAKTGRSEKDGEVGDARLGSRAQPEFSRMPSRRYQRRIVEGAQDAPRVEDCEVKTEFHNGSHLMTSPMTSSSSMHRSCSLSLGGCHHSPRSTRSAPHTATAPHGLNTTTAATTATLITGRIRGESPRSVHSAATTTAATQDYSRVSRRASSVDSQSSVDSRGHRRHRRSRGRSSDGESEASSKCSSRGHHHRHHRHHHHHHHSDDSDHHHRHRHRRRRHKSGGAEPQWAQVTAGQTQVRGHTATVRDLTHKSGYQPSGVDTEADSLHHHHHRHSHKKRHRKHRSRSRSPSEARHSKLPEELRRHLALDLQTNPGLSEAELRQIPYTKVETARTIKIKYGGSPKARRHRSPHQSKSNCSDRKATSPVDGESPPPPYTPSPAAKTTSTLPRPSKEASAERAAMPDGAMVGVGGGRETTTTTTTTGTTTTSTTSTPAPLPRVSPGPHSNNQKYSSSSRSSSSSSSSSGSSSSNTGGVSGCIESNAEHPPPPPPPPPITTTITSPLNSTTAGNG
ncbi:band 4.1-like protein 4 [Eriocheir sinensis]|uniref:band 4.1-like protein 4 n=1 Tax=Eriocheir sinensis TaxID=95602 RepID=UPI0021C8F80F|nr:band 4.1-like protein 4 [Eriocheir sinensis]